MPVLMTTELVLISRLNRPLLVSDALERRFTSNRFRRYQTGIYADLAFRPFGVVPIQSPSWIIS